MRTGYTHPAPLTVVAAAAAACALAVLIVHVLLPSAARQTHGFVSGYVASRLLLSDGFGPRVYDGGWYMRQVQVQTGWEVQEIFSPNPPTFALLSLPFAWLAPQTAKAAWLWANLVFLGLALWLSAKVFLLPLNGLRLSALFLLAAFALVSGPVESNIAWGQSYILVFLLLAGALWGLAPTPPGRGLAAGRERLAGVCLGLALVLKANGVLLLVPLLARRRWRALGWSLGTALGVSLAALPLTGWAVWAAYPEAIRAFLADPSVSVSAYQSLFGFLSHLLRYDPAWNPAPLAVLPGLVQPTYLLLLVLASAFTLWAGQRASFNALLAAFVALNVLFTPIAEEYHFAALLIPLFFLAREMFVPDPPAEPALGGQAALAAALLLLGLPLAALSPARADGWLALLAYPRLYAGILVWVLMLFLFLRSKNPPYPPYLRGAKKAWPPLGKGGRGDFSLPPSGNPGRGDFSYLPQVTRVGEVRVSHMTTLKPSPLEVGRRRLNRLTHRIHALPVLVLMPHSRCNCRCVMCDIWKANQNRQELTTDDLAGHLESMRRLGVRQVVLSGGEALMHSNLWKFCALLKELPASITLLSTGLLLKKNAAEILRWTDEVIVSLDGGPAVHDQIRNIPHAFARLAEGVAALKALDPRFRVTARCTLQRANFADLPNILSAAHALGLDQISFLAADVSSEAFNRAQPWDAPRAAQVALTPEEVTSFSALIEETILSCAADFTSGFIAESPHKLRRLPRYFTALNGQAEFPINECNAPWVSSVVEADGTVRPCFFHRALGNLRQGSLEEILNSPESVAFRQGLDVHNDPICKKCVCTLSLSARAAFDLHDPSPAPPQDAQSSILERGTFTTDDRDGPA